MHAKTVFMYDKYVKSGFATKVRLQQIWDTHIFRDWCWHLYSSCSSTMQRWMICVVIAYLGGGGGGQCMKFHAAGRMCWYFISFYFELCIWSDAISWCIWQKEQQILANLEKGAMETLVRQAFGKESMSRTWTVHNHWDRKKARQAKSEVKSILIIFFDIKGIIHKEFILAGQIANSA
jgi:hypothetical protein